jgi:hypothetical protein
VHIRRLVKSVLVRGLAILAGTACLPAQQAPTSPVPGGRSDRGTFVLKLAGNEYGTEKFSLEFTNKLVTAQSESQLREPASGQLIRTSSKLVLDASLNPQSYTWSDKGPEKFDLSVNFTSTPAKSQLHRPSGKDDVREFQLPKNVLILDNNIILHYQILLDRFAAAGGGKQTFQAYIPQSAVPGTLTVQDAGQETILLGGSQRPLRHLVVLSDNAQIDLWVDENSRLQRLYWSAPQIEALRQP